MGFPEQSWSEVWHLFFYFEYNYNVKMDDGDCRRQQRRQKPENKEQKFLLKDVTKAPIRVGWQSSPAFIFTDWLIDT